MYVYNLQYDGLYRRHLQDDPLYNRCFIRNNTEKTVSTTVQLKTITTRMILHCCSSRGAAEKCSLRTRLPNTLLQLINSFFFHYYFCSMDAASITAQDSFSELVHYNDFDACNRRGDRRNLVRNDTPDVTIYTRRVKNTNE